MTGSAFTDITPARLAQWSTQVRSQAIGGTLPQRVRPLATVDPDSFAVHVQGTQTPPVQVGNLTQPIAVMSVIKPLLLLYALEQYGIDTVFQWVGVAPSDQPFNSLTQLQMDGGRPRNPMINSGAIALCDRLPGATGRDRCDQFQAWLHRHTQAQLTLDPELLAAVQAIGQEQNQRLTTALAKSDRLKSTIAVTLDTYQRVCCLAGTIADMARLGLLLAGSSPAIHPRHREITTALMLTCGLYEASPQWIVDVGIPAKSGVSGLVLAVLPGTGAIALYSPRLDAVGNSVVGLALLKMMAQETQLSLFRAD